MGTNYSPEHPLRQFFAAIVDTTFQQKLGMAEEKLSHYVCNLLLDFSRIDQIYKIKNAAGQPLTQVADMMMEGDVLFNARSFQREREVHRHIGDFALFWTGLYPEAVAPGEAENANLKSYVRQGKESYYIVSTFDVGQWKEEADLFRRLSVEFDTVRYGLNLIREEWDGMAGAGPTA